MNGRTNRYAATVTETMSRRPKRGVTHRKYFSIFGDKNTTATVARNDSWNDTSYASSMGLASIMSTPARTSARPMS